MEGPHFAGIIGVGGGGRGVADMLVLVVSSPVFLEGFEEVEAFFFKDTAAFSALTGWGISLSAGLVGSADNRNGADEGDQKLLVHYEVG